MSTILNETFPLSEALAQAIRVQKIGEIASDNVRRECSGVLPEHEASMIEAFEAGLLQQQLVLRGSVVTHALGDILAHLTDLEDEADVQIFYEEADDRVGGPIWELLSDAERAPLLGEAIGLAIRLRPIWERHCDATPSRYI